MSASRHTADAANAPGAATSGIVIADKPAGWTSHDVVGRMRRLASTRRVGHAGTLDPMATGVLVIGVERATRLLGFVSGADKDYDATIRLGVTTNTDDAEGEITSTAGAAGVTSKSIRQAVSGLTGDIAQVPSTVSAIKVGGKRAYALARSGQDVRLAARQVSVSRFEIADIRAGRTGKPHDGASGAAPANVSESTTPAALAAGVVDVIDLDVSVTCSSGTYIRALARDLGAALGTGGHLTALRRTRVGAFTVDQAYPLDTLAALVSAGESVPVISMADAARGVFPERAISEAQGRALAYGQRISASGQAGTFAAIDPQGQLVALLEDEPGGQRARPVMVFAAA